MLVKCGGFERHLVADSVPCWNKLSGGSDNALLALSAEALLLY